MRFAPGDIVNSRYNHKYFYVVTRWGNDEDTIFVRSFFDVFNRDDSEIETDEFPFRCRCVLTFGGIVETVK